MDCELQDFGAEAAGSFERRVKKQPVAGSQQALGD
jgi:hypothetical protein